jgi:hypothetical protein
MPCRPNSPRQQQSFLMVRLTLDDRLRVEAAAAQVGLSMSAFIRRAVLDAAGTGQLDSVEHESPAAAEPPGIS